MIRVRSTFAALILLAALTGCRSPVSLTPPAPIEIQITGGPSNGGEWYSGTVFHRFAGKANFPGERHYLASELLYSYSINGGTWSAWEKSPLGMVSYTVNTAGPRSFAVKARTPDWAISEAASVTFNLQLSNGQSANLAPPVLSGSIGGSSVLSGPSSGIVVYVNCVGTSTLDAWNGLSYSYTLDGRGLNGSLTPRTDAITMDSTIFGAKLTLTNWVWQNSHPGDPVIPKNVQHYVDWYVTDSTGNQSTVRVNFTLN